MVSSEVRAKLAITQRQLALLLGVHELTISKWERGKAKPTAYQQALMTLFALAADRVPGVGQRAMLEAEARGSAAALYVLLRAVYEDEE
jgi:DNA-binding XRE family transcriptional regulator